MWDGFVDIIKSLWTEFLETVFWRLFYYVEIGICWLLGILEDVMMIFTGEKNIDYFDGKTTESMPLINVFFEHRATRGIYGAIAVAGFAFAFVFAIVAVIRKILDIRGKQQGMTLGVIIGNLFKSILIIAAMNAILLISLDVTSTLTRAISKAVQNGENISYGSDSITFTEDHYAAMGRILNTIGNYSLNPSYRSRYNINACYNDIKGDLAYLDDQGIFDFHYVTDDNIIDSTKVKTYIDNPYIEPTWQGLMEELARAHDFGEEVKLDTYDEGVTNAILDCMEILRENRKVKVLKSWSRTEHNSGKITGEEVPIDRIMFLTGTMGNIGGNGAARNDKYNINPSFTDSVRQPFYRGEKGGDIYSYSQVRAVFDPSPTKTNYILVYVASIAIAQEMLIIIVTCAVRIFNLMALYLASPLVISSIPLDDGAKFKQWTTAFLVQLLGVVGMVLSMRLFLAFLPLVWSPALKIPGGVIIDTVVRAVITYGSLEAVNKINGIFTGILADSAGWQAISAGDMRSEVKNSAAGKLMGALSGSSVAGAVGSFAKNQTWGRVSDAWKERSEEKKNEAKENKKALADNQKNRQREHDLAKKQDELQHMKEHGTFLNGNTATGKDIKKMEHVVDHLQKGQQLDVATKMAEQDMKYDKKDENSEAKREALKMKNPPPVREPAPPANQNDQV